MKVTIKGKGSITLNKNDFLASGGEGSIYVKGNIAYKIYNKIERTIPEAKIKELSVLAYPNIIRPQDILVNDDGKNCGYTMTYVNRDDVFILCELFPKAFKDRNSLTQDKIIKLIDIFQKSVKHCHSNDILLVDMNELNFLVPKTFDNFYFIDTDSYQTHSYKATAIMDSIRDRHCKNNKFTKDTDWFSFGILIFNMLTGIHPYKGSHKMYKTLDERMMHNISVLNRDVSYPKILGDFTQMIPASYYSWFEAIFEKGMRCEPPQGNVAIVFTTGTKMIINTSNNFVVTTLFESVDGHAIVDLITQDIILSAGGLYYHKKLDTKVAPYAQVIVLPKTNHAISAIVSHKQLKLYDVTSGATLNCDIYASDVMKYNNRLYIKQHDSICEIVFNEGITIIPTIKIVANIIELSTQMYPGCAFQNLMGVYFLSLFPESGIHQQIKIDELAGYRIISAIHDNKIVAVVAEKNSQYDKFIFKFSSDYSNYVFEITKNIQNTELNLIILDNGVAIGTNDEGHVELFTNSLTSSSGKIVQELIFDGNKLFHINNNVYYAEGPVLNAVRMK